jgi:hypothetical protein
VNASTQEQLEFVMSQYPDCEFINGAVTISGIVDDLSPLAQVKSVGGQLTITNNSMLTSLSGLDNVTSAKGLLIEENTVLTSVNGLESLGTVDGWLQIKECPVLSSLMGLQALTEVTGRVVITKLDALQSLTGLDALESVGEALHIVDMPVLASLDGMQGLRTVVKDILICGSYSLFENAGAPNLVSVSGLSGLTEVGGGLEINNCDNLQVIEGINNLVAAGGLVVVRNDLLTSITGFESLDILESAVNYNGIYINDNPALTTIDGTKTLRSTEYLRIEGPAITHIDLTGLTQVLGRFTLTTPVLQSLSGPDLLRNVGENLVLTTGMREIAGFNAVDLIGGVLLIDSRDSLRLLSGFNQLKSIGIGQLGWGLDIYQHDRLTAITGLASLQSVAGDFLITENDNLISVEGFQNVRSVGGTLTVRLNTSLNDCSPLCPFLHEGMAGEGL